jgi:DNA-binding NarL/FixJ family response regulator
MVSLRPVWYFGSCVVVRHFPISEGPIPQVMAKTILIADDSAQVRKYVTRVLSANQEFEFCAEAVDGLDALAKARECRPDLIILDLGMPLMNGLETARELKRVMPVVPIILFTLHGEMISEEQASSSGIDLVIAKSDISKLSEHVRSLLQPN